MRFGSREFRDTCGQFLTGVTIVTTLSIEGTPTGFTANSFTSVSLEPSLILVCVDKKLNSYQALLDYKSFAVHILGVGHEDLANQFAKSGGDKFSGIHYTNGYNDVPILSDYNAVFECKLENTFPGGDHTLFIGKVERIHNKNIENNPLGFFRGKYVKTLETVNSN